MTSADTTVNHDSIREYWRSLYYFNLYRIVLAGALLTLAVSEGKIADFGERSPTLFLIASIGMGLMGIINVITITRGVPEFSTQAIFQITADIILLTLLMHASNGIESGLALLMIVSIAASGVVLSGHLTLFFAGFATLLVMAETGYDVFIGLKSMVSFTQVGLLGAGMFTTGIVLSTLATRTRATEALAEQRAVDLANLDQVNQLIVERLDNGILLLRGDLSVGLINDAGRRLLGITATHTPSHLAAVNPLLAQACDAWRQGTAEQTLLFRAGAAASTIHARFVGIGSGTLVFLEDMTAAQERTQQIKLAALGRLSAAIAHEIRNPLGALSHAAQLLNESDNIAADDARLARIVQDQSVRINRVIESVLSLGRRESDAGDTLELHDWLDEFRATYCNSQSIPLEALAIEGPNPTVPMNSDHLNQIMSNLCQNSIRHSPTFSGDPLVRLEIRDENHADGARLDIVDFGSGIPTAAEEQLFEPFFTGSAQGTGLGLYISRELCEGNQARLDYISGNGGARFRITFHRHTDRPPNR
ncbi:MAG: HAMP domain-containing histidine kinase [Gammaproteobacteria bacterium]|nr:HAMP domain-containing histidine kinase [Gammaproteobacteria bacterium]MDH3464995.1 HAMP domain-containing histidine kinase [Gammaproteobacteria bacterium]